MSMCLTCNKLVDASYRFCPDCGGEITDDPVKIAHKGTAPAKTKEKSITLTLIDKGGKEGDSFQVGPYSKANHVLGRDSTDVILPDDEYVSPRHARLYFEEDQVWLQDLSSLNGVYVRVRGSAILKNGDQFLVGEQILRFERNRGNQRKNKKSEPFSGSNTRKWLFRIVQVLAQKINGSVWVADGRRITIGREHGTVQFNYDQFLSREHCRLEVGEQACHLHDLQSRNGTYVRKYDRHALIHGDYFFVGQQLLKVSIR